MVAREKEVVKRSNAAEAHSLWPRIVDLLLQPLNDGASGLPKSSRAHTKLNTQDIPPYKNSVPYTFLKNHPKSECTILLKKVKCHIESTKTKDVTSITQNDEDGTYSLYNL